MTTQPIYLAMVWHMHQPYYKDLVTGEYILPWVRLHGIKDYYEMVALLDDYPNFKSTYNLVPSLLLQIEDYVNNHAKDKALKLSEKDPRELTDEERVYILKNFFMVNWEVMIKPYHRYHDLLLKRGRFSSTAELTRVAGHMTSQEMLDIQVWFNLVWFGFISRKQDPVVKELFAKGRNFTADDKAAVLGKQIEVLSRIIHKYTDLSERGQIEITTSPFYHPILPLLCDTSVAKESMPHIKLPAVRFRHPEDAEHQIRSAVEYFKQKFGEAPAGMWPSEGSVSEDMARLTAAAGIGWIGTDEGVLGSSIGRMLSPAERCQPYFMDWEGRRLDMIFRNHFLSDQIGFVYQRWRAKDSVDDFVRHLYDIRGALPDDGKKYLVSVILDGENAWEYYRDGGEGFLRELHDRLQNTPNIITTRVKDFLADNPPANHLPKLFPASWINNNFRIWIGHEEDNVSWDYLARARAVMDDLPREGRELAWQELYVAEGSDWNWWYGDDHSSENDEAFDALYRKHLKNLYHLLGKEPPKHLDRPIKQLKAFKPTREPVYLIEPEIDGLVTNYYEWLSAGYFDIEKAKGAMHQIETVLRAFYYGFSQTNLYVRLDCAVGFSEICQSLTFALLTFAPQEYKLELSFKDQPSLTLYHLEDPQGWVKVKELTSFAANKIIEFAVPFADLGVKPGEELHFTITVAHRGNELERWPRGGMIAFRAPTLSYETDQWSL
jgi:alpha-amylase/alpha-mannosidase (GH57 family)